MAIIKYGPLVWLMTAGLRAPVHVPEPDYWPTAGWKISLPEAGPVVTCQVQNP